MNHNKENNTVAISHIACKPNVDMLWHVDQWAQELIEYAKKLGYNIVDICECQYDLLTKVLEMTQPAILFNFSIEENLFDTSITNDFGIVSYSSHSASRFGKRCIDAGSPFYIGFTDDLLFITDDFGTQDIFKECLLEISKKILEGWSSGSAVYHTKNNLLETVKQYKTEKRISLPLFHDMKSLTILGDMSWTINNKSNK